MVYKTPIYSWETSPTQEHIISNPRPRHAKLQTPMSLCKRIQSALTRFWWDSDPENRKTSWVAWQTLVKSKKEGGLRFRDIQAFNDALLAKISWRLISEPDCLLARVLAGKYFHDQIFLDVTPPANCSYGWRDILIGRDLIKERLEWAIGDGKEVRVWQDAWLSTTECARPMGPATEESKELKVSDLLIEHSQELDTEKINNLFPQLLETILSIRPSKWGGKDKQIWLRQSSGTYSTKTGYFSALEANQLEGANKNQSSDWLKEVWKLPIPPKLNLFLWKIKQRAIPVGEILEARHIISGAKCPHCSREESILHIFFNCPHALEVWKFVPFFRTV